MGSRKLTRAYTGIQRSETIPGFYAIVKLKQVVTITSPSVIIRLPRLTAIG
jgi:hypothetical protein